MSRSELESKAYEMAELSMEYIGREDELVEVIKNCTDTELLAYIEE